MAMALGAIGSILSAVMGFAGAQAQANIAEMNAKIAKQNAARAIERSQVEQQDQDTQTAALLGTQEALQGASGLSINSRTARNVRRSARMLGRKDALNVRQAGEIEAYNYKVDAANFSAQAKVHKMEGIGNLLTGFISAGGSLLGNAQSTAKPKQSVMY